MEPCSASPTQVVLPRAVRLALSECVSNRWSSWFLCLCERHALVPKCCRMGKRTGLTAQHQNGKMLGELKRRARDARQTLSASTTMLAKLWSSTLSSSPQLRREYSNTAINLCNNLDSTSRVTYTRRVLDLMSAANKSNTSPSPREVGCS
jgi:hypothetical protein